jgi:hypothetical protein
MRPRFLSQKMEANDPEKKMPSTAAKAMRRSAKVDRVSEIHLRAHWAFFWIQGIVSMASKRYVRRAASLMYVSMRSE